MGAARCVLTNSQILSAFLVGLFGAYFLSSKKYRPNIGQFAEMHFRAAEEDIDAARALASRENRLASFHVQQAAEKMLKGLVAQYGVESPKDHVMRGTWKRIPDEELKEIVPDFYYLEKYATQFRYPRKGFPGLDRGMDYMEIQSNLAEIQAAIDLARERYGAEVVGE